MKKTFAILTLLSLPAALAPARAGDALKLEPSFEDPAIVHSACIPSNDPGAVCIRLTDASGAEFAAWTERHVGQIIDVKIDKRIIESPHLLGPLTGGLLQVDFNSKADADAAVKGLQNHTVTLSVDVH
jgi:hypothetical protein